MTLKLDPAPEPAVILLIPVRLGPCRLVAEQQPSGYSTSRCLKAIKASQFPPSKYNLLILPRNCFTATVIPQKLVLIYGLLIVRGLERRVFTQSIFI